MIADAVEPLIEDAWRRRTESLATVAHERARSGECGDSRRPGDSGRAR